MSARSTTTRGTPREPTLGMPGQQEIGEHQLRLLPGGSVSARPDWQLDERTRSVGRLGVAQAREVLRRARPPEPMQPQPIRKAS